MAVSVIDSIVDQGTRKFKVVYPGWTGFVWRAENDLATIVVNAFGLSREDKHDWVRQQGLMVAKAETNVMKAPGHDGNKASTSPRSGQRGRRSTAGQRG
jgi:hypothetical protein